MCHIQDCLLTYFTFELSVNNKETCPVVVRCVIAAANGTSRDFVIFLYCACVCVCVCVCMCVCVYVCEHVWAHLVRSYPRSAGRWSVPPGSSSRPRRSSARPSSSRRSRPSRWPASRRARPREPRPARTHTHTGGDEKRTVAPGHQTKMYTTARVKTASGSHNIKHEYIVTVSPHCQQ